MILLLLLMMWRLLMLLLRRPTSIAPSLTWSTAVSLWISTAIVCHHVIWHVGRSALQIDVHSAGVGFGGVLETEFLANLLDAGFYFLDVAWGMIASADDTVRDSKGTVSQHASWGLLCVQWQQIELR